MSTANSARRPFRFISTEARPRRAIVASAAALAATAIAAAAGPPGALHAVSGGRWSVSRNAQGSDPVAVCVASPAVLTQWEHRGEACHATILSETPTEAVVDYQCGGGDFGHSRLTLITPRTLRIDTQGIHRGGPFAYQLHARNIGSCAR